MYYTGRRYYSGIIGCISEIVLGGELKLSLDPETLGLAHNVEPGYFWMKTTDAIAMVTATAAALAPQAHTHYHYYQSSKKIALWQFRNSTMALSR